MGYKHGVLTLVAIFACFVVAQGRNEIDDAKQMIDYASAAFCDEANILRWSCSSPSCKLTNTIGTNGTKFFTTLKTGTNAYTAVNTRQQLIVAAVRGTDNPRNVLQDLRFLKTNYVGAPSNALVHKGFYAAWKDAAEPIVSEIQRLLRLYPGYKVACAGHSFGGALAVHCAADLRQRGINATSYTYGQPRVGNAAFSSWYNSVDPFSVRVTAYNDVFPQLPPQAFDYYHQATEVWTNANGQLQVCDRSGEDPSCSNSIPAIQLKAEAHNYYLGYVFGTCYLD